MAGLTDLGAMLRELSPSVRDGRFVYVLRADDTLDDYDWEALEVEAQAVIVEEEGRTLILEEEVALDYDKQFDGVFGWITLEVHSSLQAVGLTAAVSTALAGAGISCNMLAGLHHDHLLVPVESVPGALEVLERLTSTP
ncbi:ACT domain-containing protein [Tessaracoccus sp. MC1756]|uniref:ACT domain-containing protein n=1 Tax=Tessaracoccus sp. MC1756 TaxID=2760311 RepID=UPI001603DF02|nr:ACT domain-containing protein [Tessaracoccus sp. MC1756]MBB1510671.1 ACT domain-containing protein [Tessaracoccus sp. MC1756]